MGDFCEEEYELKKLGASKKNKGKSEPDSGLKRIKFGNKNGNVEENGEHNTGTDETDMSPFHRISSNVSHTSPWPPRYHKDDLLFSFFSLVIYLADIIMDIILIYEYHANNKRLEMWLSVGFIVGPSIISGIVSLIWTYMDSTDERTEQEPASADGKPPGWDESKKIKALRVIFTFFQCGRIFRTIEFLILACRVRKLRSTDKAASDMYAMQAIKHKRDAAILGLLDGFLESALQLILQLYLSINEGLTMNWQRVIQHLSSWAATAVTVTTYYKTSRRANPEVHNMKYIPAFFYIVSRLFELGPRFLLICLGLVYLQPWYAWFIGGFLHTCVSFALMFTAKPDLEGICLKCPLSNHFIYMLFCLVHFFCYIHLEDGKTLCRSLIYYLVYYAENYVIAGFVVYYQVIITPVAEVWPYMAFSVLVGTILHPGFLCLYYKCFHPSIKETCCKKICE